MITLPVVVLNMHYSGLAIARCLGPLGVTVYGVSSNPDFPGNASKYCRFRLSPDSLAEPEQLRDFLIALADEIGTKAVLLPTRDHDIQFLLMQREALENRFIIPLASREIVDRALNKDACLAVAEKAGLAVPANHTLESMTDLARILGTLTFPVIIKPLYARQWRQPGIWEKVGHQKAAIIEDAEHLRTFYGAIVEAAPQASVQQYVPGPDSNLVIFGSYCRPGGRVRAYFTGRKLLQDPPLKGTGLIVEGLRIPEIVESSKRLLRALEFQGISEIEYKIHEVTKVPYLIEVNARHWDQHYLGAACGVNLTAELYYDLLEPNRLEAPDPEAGAPKQSDEPVRWVAEQDLLVYLLRAIRYRHPGLLDEVKRVRGIRTYSVYNKDDPAPGRLQNRNILRLLSGGIGRIIKGRGT